MRFWPFRREPVRRRLIAGLGNPGAEYAATRHNIGWRVLDSLSDRCGIRLGRLRWGSECGEGEIEGIPVLLARPLTYMNESGRAVKQLLKAALAEPADLLVVCDDLDLPPGKLRLRRGGSSGGHRGLQSIVKAIGTDQFPRLRFGIGRPPPGRDGYEHVLSPFRAAERDLVEARVRDATDAIVVALTQSLEEAMNAYN